MYSPYTDTIGEGVNGVKARSGGVGNAVVGHAIIVGSDPLDLTITGAGVIPGPGGSYPGRYPCASLHYRGTWYVGTYGLAHAPYGLNWPILGPFGGFHVSRDNGATWTPSPLSTEPGKGLFPEPAEFKGPVKLGSPHVVDFGKDMEHSPDGCAYLVGHGSTEQDLEDRKANLSWITGDQVYLCRVKPSPEMINDESQYEYFAGRDEEGEPTWSADFEAIRPLLEWDDHMGCVTITYNAPLGKYLMCVTDGWPTVETMDSYILEADRITGPYRMVCYLEDFGPQAYFVNIPSRFISSDGRTAWLCYSATAGLRGCAIRRTSASRIARTPTPGSRSGVATRWCCRRFGSGETPNRGWRRRAGGAHCTDCPDWYCGLCIRLSAAFVRSRS